jgi:hypothetical protein
MPAWVGDVVRRGRLDYGKASGGGADWKFSSDPRTLHAFRQGLARTRLPTW